MNTSEAQSKALRQKLVTIYLDNAAYGKAKVFGSYAEKHAAIEEHLNDFLAPYE